MKKLICTLSLLIVLFLVGCGVNPPAIENPKINSIEVVKNNESIEELNLTVGEQVKLAVVANDGLTAGVTWTSSDASVATVDANGNLSAVSKGTVVLSVFLTDRPFVSDSVVVKVSNKVEQTGVGSGLSNDDPIFLGNEGEDEPIEVYFIEMQHIFPVQKHLRVGTFVAEEHTRF